MSLLTFLNFSIGGNFDITSVLNLTSKVTTKVSGFFTGGKGYLISLILLDSH